MAREINLGGGEITLLKKIGLGGGQMYGKLLIDRVDGMETAEFLETLIGLIDQGYVLSNKVNIRLIEEAEKAFFRVNAAYAKDLRDAVNPGRKRDQQRMKRQRDDQADGEAQPPQGEYLTTSPGILRVCSTMTPSIDAKSTVGLTVMVMKRACPFSTLVTTPTGIPFG